MSRQVLNYVDDVVYHSNFAIYFYLISLAKVDVDIANQAAEEANVDIHKAVEGKQWSKAERASSRPLMSLAANKQVGKKIKTLEIERKKLKK